MNDPTEDLKAALGEAARISTLLDEYETGGDRALLGRVTTAVKALSPKVKALSQNQACKQGACAGLLVKLGKDLHDALARFKYHMAVATGTQPPSDHPAAASASATPAAAAAPSPPSAASPHLRDSTGLPLDGEMLHGYLRKRGDRGLVKSYRRRYFQQKRDQLVYTQSPDTLDNPLGFIDLCKMIKVQGDPSVVGGFQVVTPARTYHLQVDDYNDKSMETTLAYWVGGLSMWKTRNERLAGRGRSASSASSQPPVVQTAVRTGAGAPRPKSTAPWEATAPMQFSQMSTDMEQQRRTHAVSPSTVDLATSPSAGAGPKSSSFVSPVAPLPSAGNIGALTPEDVAPAVEAVNHSNVRGNRDHGANADDATTATTTTTTAATTTTPSTMETAPTSAHMGAPIGMRGHSTVGGTGNPPMDDDGDQESLALTEMERVLKAAAAKAQHERPKGSVMSMGEEVSRLKQQMDDVEQLYEEAQEKIMAQQHRITELESAIERSDTEFEGKLHAESEALQRLQALEGENVRLTKEVDVVEGQMLAVRQEMAAKDSLIAQLSQRVKLMQKEALAVSMEGVSMGDPFQVEAKLRQEVLREREAAEAHKARTVWLSEEMRRMEQSHQVELHQRDSRMQTLYDQLESCHKELHRLRVKGVSSPDRSSGSGGSSHEGSGGEGPTPAGATVGNPDGQGSVDHGLVDDLRRRYFLALGVGLKLNMVQNGLECNVNVGQLWQRVHEEGVPHTMFNTILTRHCEANARPE